MVRQHAVVDIMCRECETAVVGVLLLLMVLWVMRMVRVRLYYLIELVQSRDVWRRMTRAWAAEHHLVSIALLLLVIVEGTLGLVLRGLTVVLMMRLRHDSRRKHSLGMRLRESVTIAIDTTFASCTAASFGSPLR
jgi:heme/copper-type cytochrome/quinol oxidase subunit 2